MAKTWQQRIQDTIGYISAVNANGALVAGLLDEFHQANALQLVSNAMSQGSYAIGQNRQQQAEFRNRRRALILIRAVLLGQQANQAATTINAMGDGFLPAGLNAAIDQARLRQINILNQTGNIPGCRQRCGRCVCSSGSQRRKRLQQGRSYIYRRIVHCRRVATACAAST